MIAPLTILDTFSRSVANGWGTADSGHVWSSTSSTNTVSGGVGVMSSAAGTGMTNVFFNLSNAANSSIPPQDSSEVLSRFSHTGSDLYPLTDYGPILSKQNNAETFYYTSFQGNYGEIAIGVYINGTRYEISRTSYAIDKNITYWSRFRRSGSNLYLKIWREGTSEPSSWTMTTTLWTGAYPPAAGSAGFFKRGTSSSYTVNVKNFYFYTMEDTHGANAVNDTFSRTVNAGWGWSTSGHVWEGHVSADPASLVLPRQGSVATTAGGTAILPADNTGNRVGFLGPAKSGDQEVYAKLEVDTAATGTFAKVGFRGSLSISSGNCLGYGYAVQLQSGTNTIQILKRITAGGTTTAIASGTMSATMLANTVYAVRLKIEGNVLKARAWVNGSAEPSTWQATVTDTQFVTGRAWVETSNTTGTPTNVKFHQITIQPPTPDGAGVINYTTTGSLNLTVSNDYALTVTASYTNDANDNNSIAVEYKPSTSTTWTTWAGTPTVNRTSKLWTIPITGLAYKTKYDVRVTFTDVDNVHGTNPITASYTTSGNSVTTRTVSVSGVTATSAVVTASYDDDLDTNSTASVNYRVTTREQNVAEDTFDGDNGVYLQNHTTNDGKTWAKHVATTTGTQAVLNNARLVAQNAVSSDKAVYYVSSNPPSAEYDVVADYYTAYLNASVFIMGRLSSTALTGYGVKYNGVAGRWELYRFSAGSSVLLGSFVQQLDLNSIYTVRLVLRNAYKSVEVDGNEIIRTNDNTVTSTGYGGYYATDINNGSSANHMLVDNYRISYRTAAGSWTTVGAMSPNRTTKTFSRTITGLTTDTIYDFQVTFADATGVVGGNPIIATAMTIGQAVSLKAIGTSVQPTSALIDVLYEYDTNDNASISIQYRSVQNTLWTTLLSSSIVATRSTPVKRFTTTLSNLRPATTYEVRAVVDDPNGLVEGSPRELRTLFTTGGLRIGDRLRTKHYLWKVYDPSGEYIGTLTDIPDPDYSFDENGGNTDLNVTLQRRISDVGRGPRPLIAHQNRVDVWVLDPSSNGLGPNILDNPQMDASGGWTLGTGAAYDETGGPDGSSALKLSVGTSTEYETISNPVELNTIVPLVFKAICRSVGSKIAMYAKAYNSNDIQIDQSDDIAETIGTDWQQLVVTYTPPPGTSYVRMAFRNRGAGTMWADYAEITAKEMLVYRGFIETYSPKFTTEGESIDVEILGIISQLSDDYIEHLQYVRTQNIDDAEAKKQNRGPADPATIFRDVIDTMKTTNPRCALYYTGDSIKPTGTLIEYTFRDQQPRAIFDKTRELCPPNWHYFVEPDGLVILRGPEHVKTHVLKSNVNIQSLTIDRSIRNLKNYIRVKGRQDDDMSEPDGYGSINYTAFDQESMDKYGRRVMFIKDTQIAAPDIAELYGNGRLEELNKEELRANAEIPDEKSLRFSESILIGYNIEAFKPGDLVRIFDPVAGPRNTMWDQFVWDEESWDISLQYIPLPEAVPIKSIKIDGYTATLELSQRQPSAVSNYGKLARWISKQETDSN